MMDSTFISGLDAASKQQAGQQLNAKDSLILISDKPLAHGTALHSERWGIEVFLPSVKPEALTSRTRI